MARTMTALPRSLMALEIHFSAASAALIRATDFDEDHEVVAGTVVIVEEGTVNADRAYLIITDNDITVGTTPVEFGILPYNTFSAGNGIDIDGSNEHKKWVSSVFEPDRKIAVSFTPQNSKNTNVIDLETGLKIDFIVKKDTEYRKYEFKRRKITKIYDFNVWIVAPEDLTISKLEWIQQLKSDKQITDIKNLLAIPDIDKKYIDSVL